MKKTIVVTGGAGFVGSNMIGFLLKKTKFKSELLKRSLTLTVSNAGVRCVDKKGTFDQFLKTVKNKNISPRLKKLKKSILIKSPFIKKAPKASPSKSA